MCVFLPELRSQLGLPGLIFLISKMAANGRRSSRLKSGRGSSGDSADSVIPALEQSGDRPCSGGLGVSVLPDTNIEARVELSEKPNVAGTSLQTGTSGPGEAEFASKTGEKGQTGAGPEGHTGADGPVEPVSSVMAGAKEPEEAGGSARDHRVRCCSKQLVQEVLEMCTEFSKEILESQQQLSQERREQELKKCVWDFQTAFQENVSINGLSWDEASETQNEPDIKILEDKLDEGIVDTTMKRKRNPRRILTHVVKMLKTEREMLEQYKPVVTPEEFKLDAGLASRMADLTSTTSSISKQISETMKALPAQIEKADGFSQVLSLQPILESSRTRKEIFSCQVTLEDLAKKTPKPTETTPTENPSKAATVLKRKRPESLSPQHRLYPLRSKRKISLKP